jgi:glycosyltransferase involved in cell wall biosynthesis
MIASHSAEELASPSAADERSGASRPMRVAVVGVSASEVCGARDHAVLLARALERAGVNCSMHWFRRSATPARAAAAELRAWTQTLPAELERSDADVVLFHYSVFSYSHRGIPLFVHPTLSALRRSHRPLLTVLHEFAFPWTLHGLRGKLWAVTQRALLVDVMRASSAVVVTTGYRAEWLASRVWLPRRPTAVAPVFSNLPAPGDGAKATQGEHLLGMFGYSYGRDSARVVLDALRSLRERGLDVRLVLLGAPGAASPEGETWLEQARARGLTEALSFSGILPAQELADGLASCEVLLFADPPGPTSRKTTLAASLASGSAVLAFDGPQSWPELLEAGAAQVARPNAAALGDALQRLLADPQLRVQLGERGRAFAEQQMGVEPSARVVRGLLEELVG